MTREAGEKSLFIDQGIIHPPGIDGHTLQLRSRGESFLEPNLEFLEQSQEIPEEAPVILHALVFKTV
jgi:hypothetical protein